MDKDRLSRITTWMESHVAARRFAGCATLIRQGGSEVYYGHCGQRDLATGAPWQRDTVARIYSMTKPITSLALMMLVERGLFHLDAPVSEFIPGFADARCLVLDATDIGQTAPCAVPTLHQLLTHTSGLSYPFNPGVLGKAMAEQRLVFGPGKRLLAYQVDQVATLPLAFQPGVRWEYSAGIDVIGRVIEVVSGKSLEAFLVDEILGPLGMDETRFAVPEGARDRFAALYTPLAGDSFDLNGTGFGDDTLRLDDAPESSPFLTTQMHSGGGGLVGTIDDYMRFAEALRSGGAGLVSPSTLSFMMRNHLPGDIASMGPRSFAELPMDGMGFGIGGAVVLDPARARCPGSIGDFGWGGMASTFFWVDPVEDLSVVFFTQLSPSSSYPNRPQLKALVHGALI
ncbi:serine hydrolase domain-containing protein [Sulfitobacter sp. JB4-11]|uniref:serine hydrolase domain-containing protein n=1 Tax=Sulfitobacter rhodophyticola TaxID=3238304 RepID=UPI00351731B6